MAIVRGFAATAMFAGLALGLAAPASAGPAMSGHYVKTETTSDGYSATNDWYFTSCGYGCANVDVGGNTSQARLVNNQWIMETSSNAACSDGSKVPNAEVEHYTWDPNTLPAQPKSPSRLQSAASKRDTPRPTRCN